jgi:membrane protease YdiL (CAAX protease family)
LGLAADLFRPGLANFMRFSSLTARAVTALLIFLPAAGPSVAQPADSLAGESAKPPIVRPASVVLLPIVSVFIPGFGQMAQRRYGAGGLYAAAGMSGLVLATNSGYEGGDGGLDDVLHDEPGARTEFYGLGLYQGAGFLSAWDVFQASVPALQENGRFGFMNARKRETAVDLMLAPFKPAYLVKPTTWVPLGILGALAATSAVVYRNEEGSRDGLRWTPYEPDDMFFTGALSLNAGVTEEAMFRGYLFPVFHQWSGRRSWISNPAQALLFAGAHYGGVTNVPVAQGALGLYLGWLTERNQWQVGQAVAVHFWWDVIAVTTTMFTRHQVPISLGSVSLPVDL